MTNGIFKSMRHEHHFEENNRGTLMRDVFIFESPFGVLGRMFNSLILTDYMTRLLVDRNAAIKKVAESDLRESFL